MVRASRFKGLPLKRRSECKAVLFSLADRANDLGRNARPSMRTIADENEFGERVASWCCRELCSLTVPLADGSKTWLIRVSLPASQHRPKTFEINLRALSTLSDPHHVAGLKPQSEAQHGACLNAPEAHAESQDPQHSAPLGADSGPQHCAGLYNSDPQVGSPDPQHAADERTVLNSTSITAAAPRFSAKSREPNGDNYRPVLKMAHAVLDVEGPFSSGVDPDFIEAVKSRCADKQIDYGRHKNVAFDVVHRACACAWSQRAVNRVQTSARARGGV
jgi:hypothetical protein